MKRAPRPVPSLSALMRPPCASTISLQIARPSPVSLTQSSRRILENLRNRCGSLSAEMPLLSSVTATATCTPSTAALTVMTDDAGECLAHSTAGCPEPARYDVRRPSRKAGPEAALSGCSPCRQS